MRLLDEAFGQGILHYDVARTYGLGTTEADVGRFVRNKRDEVVLATKFGLTLPRAARFARVAQRPVRAALARLPRARDAALRNPTAAAPSFHFDPRIARTSLETSLRALGVDYVDLYLLHDPVSATFEADEFTELMSSLQAEGHIRNWGIAGDPHHLRGLEAAVDGPPIVQARRDALSREGDKIVEMADITFGALASALPMLLAHTQAEPATHRRWCETIGADCGDPNTLAILLLEESLRARRGRTVLMSTTEASHLRAARAACELARQPARHAVEHLHELIATDLQRGG